MIVVPYVWYHIGSQSSVHPNLVTFVIPHMEFKTLDFVDVSAVPIVKDVGVTKVDSQMGGFKRRSNTSTIKGKFVT